METITISLYVKGMSVSGIEAQIKDLYNINISTLAISRITERVAQDVTL